jgi:hypothetical protein
VIDDLSGRAEQRRRAQALLLRKQRWFIWARARLRAALAEAGCRRLLGEAYLPEEGALELRGVRANGAPLRVRARHGARWALPGEG